MSRNLIQTWTVDGCKFYRVYRNHAVAYSFVFCLFFFFFLHFLSNFQTSDEDFHHAFLRNGEAYRELKLVTDLVRGKGRLNKQYRARSDNTECSVGSEFTLFATHAAI